MYTLSTLVRISVIFLRDLDKPCHQTKRPPIFTLNTNLLNFNLCPPNTLHIYKLVNEDLKNTLMRFTLVEIRVRNWSAIF